MEDNGHYLLLIAQQVIPKITQIDSLDEIQQTFRAKLINGPTVEGTDFLVANYYAEEQKAVRELFKLSSRDVFYFSKINNHDIDDVFTHISDGFVQVIHFLSQGVAYDDMPNHGSSTLKQMIYAGKTFDIIEAYWGELHRIMRVYKRLWKMLHLISAEKLDVFDRNFGRQEILWSGYDEINLREIQLLNEFLLKTRILFYALHDDSFRTVPFSEREIQGGLPEI